MRALLLARNGLVAALIAAPILAGCSRTPAPSAEAPAPAESAPELAGGPALPPPPPPPPQRQAEPPPVITMAPIPNPPETRLERRRAQQAERRVVRPAPAPVQRRAARPAPARRPQVAQAAPAPRAATTPPPVRRVAPVRPATSITPPVAAAKPPPKLTPPARPATPAPAASAPVAAPAKPPAPAAPPTAAGVAALQGAVSKLVPKAAVLETPAQFVANQPAEVTLTLPADFADTLKAQATTAGLGDAAASVNLTSKLNGDGFVITPDETQSMPLIAGEPTVFHWMVVPRSVSPGALSAKLGADLLGGGGATLDLGAVKPPGSGGFSFTPRLIGLSLLVLIAVILAIWAARRREPSTVGTLSGAQRRAMRRAIRTGKPVDLHGNTEGL